MLHHSYFQPFGEIIYVKISTNKACGFIQYFNRQNAETAIQQMTGSIIGKNDSILVLNKILYLFHNDLLDINNKLISFIKYFI